MSHLVPWMLRDIGGSASLIWLTLLSGRCRSAVLTKKKAKIWFTSRRYVRCIVIADIYESCSLTFSNAYHHGLQVGTGSTAGGHKIGQITKQKPTMAAGETPLEGVFMPIQVVREVDMSCSKLRTERMSSEYGP